MRFARAAEFHDWLTRGARDPGAWVAPDAPAAIVDAVLRGVCGPNDILAPAITNLAVQDTDLWKAAARGASPPDTARIVKAFSSPLAGFLLANCIVPSPGLEALLTTARRGLLLDAAPSEENLAFLRALASQCFLNEYAYWQEPDETRRVAELAANGIADPYTFALLASYVPPLSIAPADRLTPFRNALPGLVDLSVTQPMREREIAARIPKLTPIQDATGRIVRDMYEENPYPRWRGCERAVARPLLDILPAEFPALDRTAFGAPARPRALIAGCGTGQHVVRFCDRYAGVDLTAIDLSLPSLCYAKRVTDTLGLAVSYGQADLIELDARDSYDVIECIGVLMTLADPLAGWRNLVACLRPGGVMKIGLYNAAARADIREAWRFIAARGFQPTPAGIRAFRHAVMTEASLRAILQLADFYSASGCRDFAFHVREVQFSVADVFAMIRALGLNLLGFYFAEAAHLRVYRARFPDDPHIRDQACLESFERETPSAFLGMMLFAVQKPL